MARCKQCEYPYATVTKCTNCGSKNPTGRNGSFIGGIIAIFVLLLISKCA